MVDIIASLGKVMSRHLIVMVKFHHASHQWWERNSRFGPTANSITPIQHSTSRATTERHLTELTEYYKIFH